MLDFSMIYNLLLIPKKKQDSTGMVDGTCYINGRFVSVNNTTIPVTDLAIMRGNGVFDTLRTYCYKTGAKVVTAKIERYLPEAKTIYS